MKAGICKSEKDNKYALPNLHIKADQRSYLIIINLKIVGLKVKLTNMLAMICQLQTEIL